jgi:hypothetical protein
MDPFPHVIAHITGAASDQRGAAAAPVHHAASACPPFGPSVGAPCTFLPSPPLSWLPTPIATHIYSHPPLSYIIFDSNHLLQRTILCVHNVG